MGFEESVFEQNIWKNKDHRRRNISSDLIWKVSEFIDEYKSTNAVDANQAPTLGYIREILQKKNKEVLITWFPTYKCALLAKLGQGCRHKPMRHLTLLGLSGYNLQVQQKWGSEPTQTVNSASYDIISVKPVESENYETLLRYVEEQLDEIYKQDAKQSAGRHKKMTPALIELVLNQAHLQLEGVPDNEMRPLKGGWCDVLHHTGGEWPLLSAVIEHLATMSPKYTSNFRSQHQHFVCHLQMKVLRDEKNTLLPLIEDVENTSHAEVIPQIDKLMIMLSVIACKTVEHLVSRYKVEKIERFLADTRKDIEESVNKRFNRLSRLHQLNMKEDYSYSYWSINIPRLQPTVANTNCQQILQLSRSNIGLVPILNTNNVSHILQYVENLEKGQTTDKNLEINLILSTIHNFIFNTALRLDDLEYCVPIGSLEKIVQKYRLWNRKLLDYVKGRADEDIRPCLTVELLSNEVLVTWIGFALVHKTLIRSIPSLEQYGQPLNWNKVCHLVLSNKKAFDAALQVSKYLKDSQKNDGNLFCLSLGTSQIKTLQFALQYAIQCPELLKIWKIEETEAKRREKEQWDKILEKKQKVFNLQETLKNQKEDLKIKREKLSRGKSSWLEIHQIQSEINRNENLLKDEREPPQPVYQPLPRDKSQALQLLFFLHMPQDLTLLARMAISAQQILIPVVDFTKHSALSLNDVEEIERKVSIDTSSWTSLINYYNQHSPSQQSSNQVLHPFSTFKPPKAGHVGPKCVTDFSSPDQAVWHPDNMQPFVLWKGGGFPLDNRDSYFNPSLEVDKRHLIEYFTEKIDSKIQYTLIQYGDQTKNNRSNKPIAKQNDKPACLRKFDWLMFASLRAYPNQQLRKVCSILGDNSLPLREPIVHTIIRQTLYHVGTVETDNDTVFALWKRDISTGEFQKVIVEQLEQLSTEITAKPSEGQSMLLITEITGYVAQWDQERSISLLRRFAKIYVRWIKDCNSQITEADAKNVSPLKAKKCVFHHYIILCYSIGNLSEEDMTHLLETLLEAESASKLKEQTIYGGQLHSLIQMRHKLMVKLAPKIVKKLKSGTENQILTKAIGKFISRVPEFLQWTNISINGIFSSCFEAWDDSDNLYSFNVLTGVFLFNGVPPSQLPHSILSHPLYKRCFQDRNFETCVEGSTLKTISPTHGFLYSFSLQGNLLKIEETNPKTGEELILLNSCTLDELSSWGYDIPIILKENYSHWYCSKREIILFRGIDFFDRKVHFIFEYREKQWHCFRIPQHLQDSIWENYLENSIELRKKFDELIKPKALAVKVLQKLEPACFIHCYMSPIRVISFHCPRFDLEFYLDGGETTQDGYRRLQSREYTGYHLTECQQLEDTLLGFERYLIIQHDENENEDMKILVPQGHVVKENGRIDVKTSESTQEKLKVYTYDVHPRFRSLLATSITARIHLADLYAACSTLVPEKRTKMCGGEMAMQLVRRSWTNQPMQKTDYEKLKKLCQHSNFTPGLNLLCYEVASSSVQTAFLHTQNLENDPSYAVEFPEQASVQYLYENHTRSMRSSLTPLEEIRVLGSRRPVVGKYEIDILSDPKVCNHAVREQRDNTRKYERLLEDMFVSKKKEESSFNFHISSTNSLKSTHQLHQNLIESLKESHDAYNKVPRMCLRSDYGRKLNCLLEQIVSERENLENLLIKSLTEIPYQQPKAISFRIFRSANIYPTLDLEDLINIAKDRSWMKHFNPFLCDKCSRDIYQNVIIWMKLCVLEDKLNRLTRISRKIYKTSTQEKSLDLQLLQELSINRTWSENEHPEWLAFEVIARIQIRPIQYTVAKAIIDGVEKNEKGPVTQLNMGEGKTRVILPMLAMYWKKSKKLVRFNFLSALLQEADDYLRNIISASAIDIKVFNFPFNRDVELNSEKAQTLVYSLQHCHQIGGVILCTPEHRQSLKLKWFELKAKEFLGQESSDDETTDSTEFSHTGDDNSMETEDSLIENGHENDEICSSIEKLQSFNYLDILDEVDEILRTKNQLIYAVGTQQALPSSESRQNVLQGLLYACSASQKIKKLLTNQIRGEVGQVLGKFKEFRIIHGHEFEKIEKIFLKSLARELIDNPPPELRWMKKINSSKEMVIRFVTDPHSTSFCWDHFEESCCDDILAMRGFLAGGLLVHCLKKRSRVDYGVNRVGGKKKLMAVPFRACETPSLRAEFGHPDCALIYTCLSYYYDGLSSEQVKEAFRTLLLLGDSAKESIYKEWFLLLTADGRYKCPRQDLFDHVRKLDLTNTMLVSLLTKNFNQNIRTINFWLNYCVFPQETMQFPYQLQATAWDIAHNSRKQVAGFSGTNDEKLLMPSSLEWMSPTDEQLIGTDGKMVQLLLRSDIKCIYTDGGKFMGSDIKCIYTDGGKFMGQTQSKKYWEIVLDTVILEANKNTQNKNNFCALIDAGALMAGAANNVQVAQYLVAKLERTKGVVYFDIDRNGWWVRDKIGREWPKHSSPIQERDGFVYFDESRTRGADMKLNSDSCAVLTLGPGMCKDKLMQAAGRMRMLEHGQQLCLFVTEEIASKIRDFNYLQDRDKLKPVHVLRWVIDNTVDSIVKWLPEWAIQGGSYFIKERFPELSFVKCKNSLQEMYGSDLREESVCGVWEEKRRVLLNRANRHAEYDEEVTSSIKTQLEEIDDRIHRYGEQATTKMGSNVEEECERELEKERELQIEVEKEIPALSPHMEISWNAEEILYCKNPRQLQHLIPIQRLGCFIADNIFFEGKRIADHFPHISSSSDPRCWGFRWPKNIYGTKNFFDTIEDPLHNNLTSKNEYLRLIEFIVVFRNREVLLISEQEADKILELTWREHCDNFALINLTFARKRHNGKADFETGSGNGFFVSEITLAALALFQGKVMYPKEKEYEGVEGIIQTTFAENAASLFCKIRGLEHSYSRSHLETICTPCAVD